MSITMMTGFAFVCGLVLLGTGAKKVIRDWEPTPFGRTAKKTLEKTYPNRGSTLYATFSTGVWLLDVMLTLGIPITIGFMLDPYSGPFVGAVVGIFISLWWRYEKWSYESRLIRKRRRDKHTKRYDKYRQAYKQRRNSRGSGKQ